MIVGNTKSDRDYDAEPRPLYDQMRLDDLPLELVKMQEYAKRMAAKHELLQGSIAEIEAEMSEIQRKYGEAYDG